MADEDGGLLTREARHSLLRAIAAKARDSSPDGVLALAQAWTLIRDETNGAPVVKSHGTATIHGTFRFDFDAGQETHNDTDVHWEQITDTTRRLTPLNAAQLANLGTKDFDKLSLAQLRKASYGPTPINGSDAADEMPVGTVIAIRTSQLNFAKVLIDGRNVPGTRPEPIQNIRVRWVTFVG